MAIGVACLFTCLRPRIFGMGEKIACVSLRMSLLVGLEDFGENASVRRSTLDCLAENRARPANLTRSVTVYRECESAGEHKKGIPI